MSAAALEKRQLAKIHKPLEKGPLPLPLVNDPRSWKDLDPKTMRRLISLYRRELKDKKQAVIVDAAKEVGLGSVAAVIYSGGQIAKSTIEGFLDIEASIAGNPDPVSQLFAVGAQAAGILWFATTPLGRWIFKHLIGTVPNFPGAKDVLGAVNAFEGRDDVNGAFGVGITSDDQLSYVSFEWYGTPGLRDVALVVLSLSNPLHAEKVDRTGNAINGWTTPATAYVRAHPPPHLPFAVYWQGPPSVGLTIVGYWADLASAQTQASLYNKAFNRNAYAGPA